MCASSLFEILCLLPRHRRTTCLRRRRLARGPNQLLRMGTFFCLHLTRRMPRELFTWFAQFPMRGLAKILSFRVSLCQAEFTRISFVTRFIWRKHSAGAFDNEPTFMTSSLGKARCLRCEKNLTWTGASDAMDARAGVPLECTRPGMVHAFLAARRRHKSNLLDNQIPDECRQSHDDFSRGKRMLLTVRKGYVRAAQSVWVLGQHNRYTNAVRGSLFFNLGGLGAPSILWCGVS